MNEYLQQRAEIVRKHIWAPEMSSLYDLFTKTTPEKESDEQVYCSGRINDVWKSFYGYPGEWMKKHIRENLCDVYDRVNVQFNDWEDQGFLISSSNDKIISSRWLFMASREEVERATKQEVSA